MAKVNIVLNYQSNYIFFLMTSTSPFIILLSFLTFSLLFQGCNSYEADILYSRNYYGNYISRQADKNFFGYLHGVEGQISASFFTQPRSERVDSVRLRLMDPKYRDGRVIQIDINGIFKIDESTSQWKNTKHSVNLTQYWKEREIQKKVGDSVSTIIIFQNLDSQDFQEVSITLKMKGASFDFTAELHYDNLIEPTIHYIIYTAVIVMIQIYSAFQLVKISQPPHYVFTNKFSLITLTFCLIQDLFKGITSLNKISQSDSGHLLFIIPTILFIILFAAFDIRIAYSCWKNKHYPQVNEWDSIKMTVLYSIVTLYGFLFIYFVLFHFYNNQLWSIILRSLMLLPQIIYNATDKQKVDINFNYIFGYVGTRILFPLYDRGYIDNVFRFTPDSKIVTIIVSIFTLQVILLTIQSKLGPRSIIPRHFLPNYFEYKETLKFNDTTKHIDCAICLQNLFVKPNINATCNYSLIDDEYPQKITSMRTPCNHRFHQECLKQWLQVKLDCPICRRILPPI